MKPALDVGFTDLVDGGGQSSIEGLAGEGLDSADDVLELGPGFFDGVELWRLRRSKQQLAAGLFDLLADVGVFVGAQVVHHHHVAGPQIGQQLMLDERPKDVVAGARIDGHESSKSIERHGPDRGDGLPLAANRAPDGILTARSPAMAR